MKGGLFIAPRTVLKVICWGDSVVYPNGKIAFSFMCPIENLDLKKGYRATNAAKTEAGKKIEKKKNMKWLM